MMLSQLAQFAQTLWSRRCAAAHQLFRRLTQPARSNLVTRTLADLPRRRSELLAENARLRQPLRVWHRQVKTPRLTGRERLALWLLTRWVPQWKPIVQIVQPQTLWRWQRQGFRWFWRVKSRGPNPANRLGADPIALIHRLARENPLWEPNG